MAAGWMVKVEVEAGRGELEPLVFIVALDDFQEAIEAAKRAPEVTQPRSVLGNQAPSIYAANLVHPVDARTIRQLDLSLGQVWNVNDPPTAERIVFARKP